MLRVIKKYLRFVGPGLMVAVAYMDPGNYSTAVAAGSVYRYKLLFSVMMSTCLGVYLQVLSAKLGAVTGLDLASNCREHLSYKTNLFVYIMTEIAIIATDLAEVVGCAVAINIIFGLPLILGVLVTVVDVLVVLMAYRPNGPMLFIRIFEGFVSLLVAATVVCFAFELWQVSHDEQINFKLGEVLSGFLPSSEVVEISKEHHNTLGLFLSLAILGATVMPHLLYLGSGLVQARLKEYDIKSGFFIPKSLRHTSASSSSSQDVTTIVDNDTTLAHELLDEHDHLMSGTEQEYPHKTAEENLTTANNEDEDEDDIYRPLIHAIKDTMAYTLTELVISLFTVALFVNSAILIVAGATLTSRSDHRRRDDDDNDDYDSDDDNTNYESADLYTIYNLLSRHLNPTAGFVFALALLCSGQSAGVVCTLAGQMVSEGFMNWSFPPVVRRLITRLLAIVPCVIAVMITGRNGLSQVLNYSQVVLSILLPAVTAPLIYFTCSKKIMRVPIYFQDEIEVDTIVDFESTIDRNNNNAHDSSSHRKYTATQPAIRLQELRNSHPCSAWDDEDDDEGIHRFGLMESSSQISVGTVAPTPGTSGTNLVHSGMAAAAAAKATIKNTSRSRSLLITQVTSSNTLTNDDDDEDDNVRLIKGYKDMSNGRIGTTIAVTVWIFVTVLNGYLILSVFED